MNYTMPFLWVADNNYEYIGKQIERIKESGSNCFCVESRTHQDFCGKKWWEVMDFIIETASTLKMKVWLLDDKHYPTGCANGAVLKNLALQQKQLFSENTDIVGPCNNVKLALKRDGVEKYNGQIYSVSLLKRISENSFTFYADLTDSVKGDFLKLSLSSGHFRVCVIYIGQGIEIADYRSVDMLNKESVNLLIKEVYEPHYQKYKGTCFEGFFSDEPRFGNDIYDRRICKMSFYGGKVGTLGLSYPWRNNVDAYLKENVVNYNKGYLAALWNNIGNIGSSIKTVYMDYITKCYAENFSGQLSNWCHNRQLKYASHIIEDMGAHTATYNSAGHYFRSQKNADFAGIDVVLHQIKPHYSNYSHIAPIAGGVASPLFFDNTLAKLASSCAHLDPIKEDRALCEIFGAYGWAESSFEMLYLVNHMIVRGVNYFIPHAFSSIYPNEDCPPYFDYNNENYSYKAYKIINGYINQIGKIFEGSKDDIKVAILYHAEAEWSGERFMPIDSVCKKLLSNQIDFDIISEDHLKENETDAGLTINGRKYDYLLIPYREYISEEIKRLLKNIENYIKVFFIGKKKERTPLNLVVEILKKQGLQSLKLLGKNEHIRVRKIIKENNVYYFVHNEDNKAKLLKIHNNNYRSLKVIDILNRNNYLIPSIDNIFNVKIEPGQALVLEESDLIEKTIKSEKQTLELLIKNVVAIDSSRNQNKTILTKINIKDVFFEMPDFSGVAEIYGEIDCKNCKKLEIEFTGNYLEIYINEEHYERVVSPAIIDINNGIKNKMVRFRICNTLADKYKDRLSKYSLLEPVGILNIFGIKKS